MTSHSPVPLAVISVGRRGGRWRSEAFMSMVGRAAFVSREA